MFRQQALDRHSSPDDLDTLQVVVGRKEWLSTLACSLICAAGLAWSLLGRIPVTVNGTGVLINPGNVRPLQSLAAGQVTELLIHAGDTINKGDVIARLSQPEIRKQIEQQRAALSDLKKAHQDATTVEDARWTLEQDSAARQSEFLASEIDSAQSIAASILQKDVEFQRAQRTSLRRAEQISRELNESYVHSYEAALRLKQRDVGTDRNVLAAQIELRDNELTMADYEVQLRQLDVTAIESDRRHQEQQNRIADLTIKQQQVHIELQRLRQELLEKTAKREREIRDAERSVERLILDLERQSEIRSEFSGRVLELAVSTGQVLSAATRLGSVELSEQSGELMSMAYFKIGDGKRIEPGMTVHVTPSTVAEERFGAIVGRVRTVSEFPITRAGAVRIVGNDDVAAQLIESGGAIAVEATLNKEPNSASGFQWTSIGPETRFSTGTTAGVRITVEQRAPITWLLPLLRSWIKGEGGG